MAREKRFLIHALLDGQAVVAHTNNSGSMLGLLRPGMEIFLCDDSCLVKLRRQFARGRDDPPLYSREQVKLTK